MRKTPEWAVVGAKVVLIESTWQGNIGYPDTVARVLKQYVELAGDGLKFNFDGYQRGREWGRLRLRPADDHTAVMAMKRSARVLAQNAVETAFARWQKDQTPARAMTLKDSVDAWVDAALKLTS